MSTVEEASTAQQSALVEAVLFLEAEPLDEKSIAVRTGLETAVVESALELLCGRRADPEFGITPVRIAGGWVLSPKEHLWASLRQRYGRRREEPLSRAAMETLAIIAYSQPLTRAEVETIRGVGAEGMIRALREKNLIREVGRKDSPGRPVLYGTTREFLKIFRLESIADLPKLDELEEARFAADGED